MKYLALLLAMATSAHAKVESPQPFPVFLKLGFSSVLEFDETPARVVLGDPQKFQVERLEKSLVIRTLAPYAASNMFVYFQDRDPAFFILTASEDAEPTYHKSFVSPQLPVPLAMPMARTGPLRAVRISKASFDTRKDYLTVDLLLTANSAEVMKPKWDLIRMMNNSSAIVPTRLWAERKSIQKDSSVKARLIFAKPNVPRNLSGTSLVVPFEGRPQPIRLWFTGTAQ